MSTNSNEINSTTDDFSSATGKKKRNFHEVSSRYMQPSRKASTPLKCETSCFVSDDISIILPNQSVTSMKPTIRKELLTVGPTVPLVKFRVKQEAPKPMKSIKINLNQNETIKSITQAKTTAVELEILYSQYLQSELLKIRAKRSMDEQAQKLMYDLSQVSALTDVKLAAEAETKEELDEFDEKVAALTIVKEELNVFGPIVDELEQVSDKLEDVTTVLKNTQHQLVFHNTALASEDNLENLLDMTNYTLQQLVGDTQPILQSLAPLKDSVDQIAADAKDRQANHNKIKKSLKEMDRFTTQATSLEIQELTSFINK